MEPCRSGSRISLLCVRRALEFVGVGPSLSRRLLGLRLLEPALRHDLCNGLRLLSRTRSWRDASEHEACISQGLVLSYTRLVLGERSPLGRAAAAGETRPTRGGYSTGRFNGCVFAAARWLGFGRCAYGVPPGAPCPWACCVFVACGIAVVPIGVSGNLRAGPRLPISPHLIVRLSLPPRLLVRRGEVGAPPRIGRVRSPGAACQAPGLPGVTKEVLGRKAVVHMRA
jgi:hypothetical protein